MFGCCVWSVASPPYEEAIRRIASLGFKGIELIAWNRESLDEYFTPRKVKELRELMEFLGMELTGFNVPIQGVTSLKKEDQDAALSLFKKQVELTQEFGAKIATGCSQFPFHGIRGPNSKERPLVQTFGVDIPYNVDLDVVWKSYVNLMKKFADVVEDAGLRYAIEGHAFELVCNADGMLRLFEHVGSKALGVQFDIAQWFPSQEMIEVSILKLKERIFHTHINDSDGLTNCHFTPGKGKVDFRGVLKAFKAIGYDYVLSFALEDVPGVRRRGVRDVASPEHDVELRKAMEYVRSVAEEVGVVIE